MKKNVLTRQQAHELLMRNNRHYLWNVPYHKWTEEDYQNLIKIADKIGAMLWGILKNIKSEYYCALTINNMAMLSIK